MDSITYLYLENLQSPDKNLRYEALIQLLQLTEEEVDWAYEVWDQFVADLKHSDNHRRSIAAQLLARLAKSDPEQRMANDFAAILEVTKDKRFVTARHALQSIWRIGLAGEEQKQRLVQGLTERYKECLTEKNYTLIRYDIIQGFRNLYDATGEESLKQKALELIELEEDLKYRKKYASVWK